MRLRSAAALILALMLPALAGCYNYGNRYAQEVGDPYPGSGEEASDRVTAAPRSVVQEVQEGSTSAPVAVDVANLPELRLDVAEIQVIPAYVPPRQKPNVEHLASPSPQDAAEAWARAKVKAVGRSNRAMVIVRQASIVEVPLPTKSGIEGAFTREPDRRYDGTLEAEIEFRNDSGQKIASAEARALRTQSVVQGTSDEARKAVWSKMSRELAADLAAEFERQMKANLASFLR